MDRRWGAGIVAATASGVLLLPGTAAAQPDGIPPIPVNGRHPTSCGAVKATYRVTVADARRAKRDAYAAARSAWFAGVADEKQRLADALAAADTRREVKRAHRVYRITTADERAARAEARREARKEYRATVKRALRIFRKGWRTCR